MIKKLDFKNKEKGKETTVFLKRDDIKTMKKDIVKLGELGFQIERERISGFKPKESMAVEEAEAIKEEKAEEEIEIEAPRGIAEEEKKEEEEEKEKEGEEEEEKEKRRLAEEEAKERAAREEERKKLAEEEAKERAVREEERKKLAEEEAKERAAREEERKKLAEEEAKERAAREEERRRQEKLSAEKAEEQRLINIDKEIEDIAPEKAALNKEKGQFLTEIKSFETQLEPILEEEKLIENKILEMEELEKITPLEKRSQIEKKRWEISAKRRDLEKTKWSIQEKIEKVKEKIKDLELKEQGVLKGEDELKEEKEKILQKRQEERLIQEKSRLKNEIFQIIDEKKIIENKENELLAKKNRIETELKELLEEEQTTEEVIRDIERKEKEISDPEEQKKIEKSRWKIEDDRKTLETKRWELEQEKKDLSAELKKVEKEEQEILKKENPLRERLKEIDRLLKISPEEAPEEEALEEEALEEEAPEEEAPEKEEERKEEERKEFEEEAIEPEEKVAAKAPTPKFGGERQVEVERAKEKEEEKEEEEERRKLIEEEIKKRIAKEAERRQEENLLAEKKRFLEKNQKKKEINEEEPFFENLEVEEDKSSFSPFAAAREIEKEIPETLIPKPPKKPSLVQKILIRILIIAIILLVIGFFYWFFAVKKPEIPEEIIIPPPSEEEIEEELPPTEEEIIEELEIIIPASLISVNATETLEIMNSSEIPQLLSQIIKKSFETEGHIRLLFKNVTENKIVGLKEFFDAFEVKTPEGLFEKLNNDFTLFIFSSQGLNRLGFVTKIKEKENLVNLTLSWEPTMEKDTEKLFEVLGKEEPALSSVFKNSLYQETSFRFLTVSREDFGICYALFNDYFVFASSFESMKKTIDLTKVAELENQISQLFIVGFDGTTLTPQLEEFFHKYKPGGVLLLSKNIENREQLKKLTEDLQNLSLRETGLPLFIAVDQEGGIISRVDFLQEKTPQSEIKSSNEAYQVGLTRGQELKELGINLNLAPLLDAAKEGDFLFNRSFQKNAAEAGNLAKSLIEGQKKAGIFTAVKHFPGYGGISFNPEESLAKVETLPEISQFKKAIEANPEFVMAANAVYKNLDPSLPFIFSPTAIQFLKNNLGSKIAIVTDDLAQNYLLENFSLKDIMLKPIQAGANILIFSGWEIDVPEGLNVFFDAFKKGEISQAKIKEAISKIIKIKESLR